MTETRWPDSRQWQKHRETILCWVVFSIISRRSCPTTIFGHVFAKTKKFPQLRIDVEVGSSIVWLFDLSDDGM